ncbi:hypothetical protein [Pseudacidovorax intermedius]|nr:hypothetical protein [Pseudacidovorax intermedius]
MKWLSLWLLGLLFCLSHPTWWLMLALVSPIVIVPLLVLNNFVSPRR